ncbi:nicotinate-nucleotide--dimethylbenzimidazole phosphoribosyltransferase [Streptomyces sp. Je 1-369]|uniref:nicotinate-nucleotide--dimethylbenzimidazole phosphoribosyltransferase n=1 Tax=Streptomyces sp. Je 1-369 TaxID=2966192 RepID=UPI0022864413|nr:nicotinate-nucleotide--dimethylbenzimidazole phosphoribosyltransferase [Streptomyces sp. Je 1-369]WAL94395.1 nicotinate-nucleotide--dimethylbenzimidazole phosphoribosyltransferase [Streptomyces sp. Je 1-369]
MTDTGQVPGEGLPEGAGNDVPSGPVQGMGAQQPGVPAPGAYPYADPAAVPVAAPAAAPADEDDLLLMPGAQGAWGEGLAAQGGYAGQPAHAAHQPGPHETSGRDSGSVDLNGVRLPGSMPAPSHPGPARRPLHHGPSGPAVPDGSGSPVRSLADRGPAPTRHAGPPTGPEYLDIPRDDAGLPLPGPQLGEIPPQGGTPWGSPQEQTAPEAYAAPAETVVPQVPQATEGAEGAVATEVPVGTGAPDVAGDASVASAPQTTEAPQAQDSVPFALPTEAPEAPVASQAPVAAPVDAPAFPHAADAGAGQADPVAQQGADLGQVPSEEQQFSVAEQPVFAQAVPAGVGQPAFAVASAQPWDGAQLPHAPEAVQPGFAPEARHAAPGPHHPEGQPAQGPAAPVDAPLPGGLDGAQDPAPIGRFVPVDGTVPTTPHLAPTPPHPLVVPQEAPAVQPVPEAEGAEATEGAPSEAAPAPTAETVTAEAPAASASASASAPAPEAVATEAPVAEPATPAEAPEVSVAPEAPANPDVTPEAAQQPAATVTVPAPRDGAQPTAQPDAVPDEAAPEAALGATPEVTETPQVPPVSGVPRIVSSAAAPTEFPAAPETADPADELDEADEVISFEPIEANEVTEVAEAPEMAEAPEAAVPAAAVPAPAPAPLPDPEDATGHEGPEALAPVAAVAAPEAADDPDADAPEILMVAPAEAVGAPAPEARAEGDAEAGTAAEAQHAPDLAEPVASPGTAAPGYADAEREAVLRVMRERRDIRNGFRNDAIPHEVLLRVLEAAHTAPSVGHSQPWDFVVIKSAETRRSMHELATRQRDAYAKSLPKGRAKQFKELKIEAILDTPVNIVVTADPTRGGRHTLGRHTQPQMAPYSSALAVENLWLAARAEGLGVGWVSFFDEREMVRALGLPEHLEVVAYLCVGYVDEFPDEPELMQAGWSKRRPLSWVVHEETYGRRALPGEDPHDLLAETVANIRPLDAKALGEAWERQKRMTKPPGALGMLEIISAQLSGLSRMCPPPIPEPAAVAIFAGDHGVHAQGVTAWPQEVTAQMVANFLGGGAVCNAFANQVGAEVCVIDVGVASELPATPGLLPRKVRAGTADMTTGPALTREEVKAAIEVGIETARDLVAAGNKALLTGEMGIANTTASAALISVYTDTDPAEVTGRGTGINDEMHTRKVEVVRRALDLHQPDPADPVGVLAAIGGLEHAAMVGLLLGGASLRTPVILDGVSAGAAALVARAIAPEVLAACIAGHRSAEPGHVAALNKLGLRPLVDLDLRLGEGTGALLALPVVQSAARAMHEVATFDSAGVTEK